MEFGIVQNGFLGVTGTALDNSIAKELSTGQRKRLELARAMATEPKLLMMDEVTGGVDQKTVPGLVRLIKKLNKSTKIK